MQKQYNKEPVELMNNSIEETSKYYKREQLIQFECKLCSRPFTRWLMDLKHTKVIPKNCPNCNKSIAKTQSPKKPLLKLEGDIPIEEIKKYKRVELICSSCNSVTTRSVRMFLPDKKLICSNCLRAESVKEKYGETHIARVKSITAKKQATMIQRYGCANPSHNKEINKKKSETWKSHQEKNLNAMKNGMIGKYGVDNASKIESVRWRKSRAFRNNHKKIKTKNTHVIYRPEYHYKSVYIYNNLKFDSSWELAFYIYCIDKGKNIIRETCSFTYNCNGLDYSYFPDFRVNGALVEIKGLQFFENRNPASRMINPFDRSLDEKFEAKHQCMIRNGVQIITDCSKYINYVAQVYGKDFLKSCRIKN
mgnify:CR=1 FL=1